MSPPVRDNPYVGPDAFRREDADRFFGRDREAKNLCSLMMAESLVLFFAQSGTGKTSLIQARLVPELLDRDFDVLTMARVGTEPPAGTMPTNVYVFSALWSLEGRHADPARLPRLQSLTLGSYLWTKEVDKPRRVLIFDQFEEILTTQPQHWEQREGFFLQLRQALEDEPSLSVLLVMREDNLAGLEYYAPLLPGKLRTRFRMESLRYDDAVKAVGRPAEIAGRRFEPGVAEQLVNNLRRVQIESPYRLRSADPGWGRKREKAAFYLGEFVEPLQLQVVCYELWENLRPRPGETITADDLRECGDIDQALEDFYKRGIREASESSGVSAERLREWCGEALITPRTRIRCQVSWEPGATAGLRNEAVQALVKVRLVREQEARGGTWYELVHDRFIEPVLRSIARQKQAIHLRRLVGALALSVLAVVALAKYGYSTSRLSASRELAAQAVNLVDTNPGEALLQAANAAEAAKTLEAEIALHAALNARFSKLWEEPMKSANAVAFSPDGLHLAAVGDDGEVELLTVAGSSDDRKPQKLAGHSASVTSVAFSPDGGRLATGDSEGRIVLRRMNGGAEPAPLVIGLGEVNVNGLAFSPDGKTLAVASDSPLPTLWDAETGKQRPKLSPGRQGLVWDVAFSGDGSLLATGGDDRQIVLWKLETRRPERVLSVHSDSVRGVAFQPGERPALLASSSQDNTARLWDLRPGSARSTALLGHKGWVVGIAFSPDGAHVATASLDGSAKVWDLSARRGPLTLLPGAGPVAKVAFSPRPGLLATASQRPGSESGSGGVAVWRVLLHEEEPTILLADSILGMVFSRDDKLLAAYGKKGRGVLWDPISGAQEERSWCRGDLSLRGVSFSNGGEYVTCIAEGGAVVVAHTADRSATVAGLPATEVAAEGASYSPTGPFVATVSRTGMNLWEFQGDSWKGIASLPSSMPLRAVAFSRDGKRLALGRDNGSVVVWDRASQKILQTLRGHGGAVLAVAFSPDGSRLATGSADQTAKLWDLTRTLEIATFPGYQGAVSSLAFNRDGSVLAAADASGVIRLEALGLEELVARARRRLAQWASLEKRR